MMQAEEIRPEMNARCKDVTEVLEITMSAATVLLNAFRWSTETLIEQYMNDSKNILKTSGVYNRCLRGSSNTTATTNTAVSQTCYICFEDCNQVFAMPCGHAFCLSCWKAFCVNAVEEGPSCVITTCPDASCAEIVTDDEFALALGTTSPAYMKFKNFQLRTFVESNPLTRWCPGRGCECVAYAIAPAALDFERNAANCEACITKFCFECGEEPHAPASCKAFMKWSEDFQSEKSRRESELKSRARKGNHIKSCPKCSVLIEKNGGCNHMGCTRCGHEFCWICLGDGKKKFCDRNNHALLDAQDITAHMPDGSDIITDMSDGSVVTADISAAWKTTPELDRYLHYYSRYNTHDEEQKAAQNQLQKLETQMIFYSNVRWTDVELLKRVNQQLIECRRVLKYTYVIANNMTFPLDVISTGTQPTQPFTSRSNVSTQQPQLPNTTNDNDTLTVINSMNQTQFQHLQETLERFTKDLSALAETPIHELNRIKTIDQSLVVDLAMQILLNYVDDGMDDQ
jgi:ariadne-1